MTARCDKKHKNGKSFILEQAKQLGQSFCYREFCPPMSYGYFRNCISTLARTGHVIPLPGNPRFYILPEWKSRYSASEIVTSHPIRVHASRGGGLEGRRVLSGFSGFLESLPYSGLVHVHDVNFRFSVADFSFVNRDWVRNDRGRFWHRRFDVDGWSCSVNAYESTRTVTVSLGCRFFYSTFGLNRLICLLGRVWERLGNVSDVMNWIVTVWHYGKDLKCAVRGRDFEVCFETFAGCLGRIYYKHDLSVVRFEEIQKPGKPLSELFEHVLAKEGASQT